MKLRPLVIQPGQVDEDELLRFKQFVRLGGEVSSEGLLTRIGRAAYLCLLTMDGEPAAVGALKRPTDNHRAEIAENSGYALDDAALELGWIVVKPEYRGRRLSAVVARALLEQAAREGAGVFCTVRADNLAIQRACRMLGFRERGQRWPGTRGMLGLGVYAPGIINRLVRRFICFGY